MVKASAVEYFPDFGRDLHNYFTEPEVALKRVFLQRGFVRIADKERKLKDPKYRKGFEVRLIARNESELLQIRHWLDQVGLKPGKPYRRHSRLIQPIYGKVALTWFQSRQ